MKTKTVLDSILPVIIFSTAILIVLLLMFFSLMKEGIPLGHDIDGQVIGARIFIEALSQGQFPVRWIELAWEGTSSPLFNFYQVGFFYLVSLIHFGGFPFLQSLKIGVFISWLGGAFFMFLLAKRFGQLAGILAAFILVFTPYLLLDIFVRTQYGELTGISFTIGSIWALDRVITRAKSFYVVALALLVAGLIISHPITAVIVTPVLLSYAALLILNHEAAPRGKTFASLGSILGVGIASFYFLPALVELPLINSSNLTTSYFDFRNHFVYPSQLFETFWGYGYSLPGTDDGMSFQIGVIQWFIITIAIFYLLVVVYQRRVSSDKCLPHLLFWLLTINYSLFFMQKISLAFWEGFPPMSFIQFPWRYLLVPTIACPVLAAICASLISKAWQKELVILGATGFIVLIYRNHLVPEAYLPDRYYNINSPEWRTSPKAQTYTELAKGSFLPIEVEQLPNKDTKEWDMVEGTGQIKKIISKYHHKTFLIQAQSMILLSINIHYFPGWKAYLDGKETEINYSNKLRFMHLRIPPGTHTLETKFTDTPIRFLANIISLSSLFFLGAWQLLAGCKNTFRTKA